MALESSWALKIACGLDTAGLKNFQRDLPDTIHIPSITGVVNYEVDRSCGYTGDWAQEQRWTVASTVFLAPSGARRSVNSGP